MTIYTLFLYIALVALGLLATLGYGHSKWRKDEIMHHPTWFIQYFMGALLIWSGLVKAVDPLGTAYKMKDYFFEFKQQGFPLMDLMADITTPFSVLMIVVELVVGICLILGIGGRANLWANLIMMLFFTFLTGFNYLTGFTPKEMLQGETTIPAVGIFEFSKWAEFDNNNIRISDCGCFGDFIKLTPLQTFLKDILLTGLAIYLFRAVSKIKELFPRTRIRTIIANSAFVGSVFFCLCNFYFGGPMVDFRPFAEGVNVPNAKADCAAHPTKKEINFVYKNKTTGKEETFLSTKLPADLATNWTYVSRKDKVLEEGCNSKVMEFQQFPEIEDYTQYPELAKSNGYAFLMVAADLTETDKAAVKSIINIAQAAESTDSIPTYGLYAKTKKPGDKRSEEEALEAFRHDNQAAFEFRFGDDKLVLTIMRANPGLILFHKGTIVQKWHHKHIPSSYEDIKKQFMK